MYRCINGFNFFVCMVMLVAVNLENMEVSYSDFGKSYLALSFIQLFEKKLHPSRSLSLIKVMEMGRKC